MHIYTKYLYILFEDGELRQSINPPTESDSQSINNGLLAVIRFNTSNCRYEGIQSDNSWKEV